MNALLPLLYSILAIGVSAQTPLTDFETGERYKNREGGLYESGFAIRSIILKSAQKARTSGPVIFWGPYFWANGETPRKDGIVWKAEDLNERDGTHLSNQGTQKAAALRNFS